MLKPNTTSGITVGELISQLRGYPAEAELFFGGLRFNRRKRRGDKLVQLEFMEQGYRTATGALMAEDILE